MLANSLQLFKSFPRKKGRRGGKLSITPRGKNSTRVTRRYDSRSRRTAKNGLLVFSGVPYAEPPVNFLRFSPPRSPEPWRGTRESQEFAPVCPQVVPKLQDEMKPVRYEYLERLLPYLKNQSEDCLYLNIYAPHQPEGKRTEINCFEDRWQFEIEFPLDGWGEASTGFNDDSFYRSTLLMQFVTIAWKIDGSISTLKINTMKSYPRSHE